VSKAVNIVGRILLSLFLLTLYSVSVVSGKGLFPLKNTLPSRDTLLLRDTLITTDSLKLKGTFRVRDSLQVADSLKLVDSLAIKLPLQGRERRDSIRAKRDSIRWEQPRILESYAIPDSMRYKRMVLWNNDTRFNNISMVENDTSYNHFFQTLPFLNSDVGATHLGVTGSAVKSHNYFLQERFAIFEHFEPYLPYSYLPETLPYYNVKSPNTQFGYWGTLLANTDKEESNIKLMHTQNLSPELNLSFLYRRYGANGQTQRESTDNRTVLFSTNYLGKRYLLHAGYIYQGVKRDESGGIIDDRMVLDTTLEDSKDLEYILRNASNVLKRNSFYLSHSYGIPIKWGKKRGDTLQIESNLPADSLAVLEELKALQDSLPSSQLGSREGVTSLSEGTVTYFGHSFEYSSYHKKYIDQIDLSDTKAREFYNNRFLLSQTNSFDSIRVSSLENRAYIRIQPWAQEAIVSKLDGGAGYQIMNIYNFQRSFYTSGRDNDTYNNLYLYFGAEGRFRKYFQWDANSRYYLAGYWGGNLSFDANIKISLYPKGHSQAITIRGSFELENRTPSWFATQYHSNHYSWVNNSFHQTVESRVKGQIDIPKYKLALFGGYSLLSQPIYYGIQGLPAQYNGTISILSLYAQKNFKLAFLHFDNRVLFQLSSNNEIVPLPKLSANLRYYIEHEVVRGVLSVQLGANMAFNTAWYAQAYNPALGIFHNQNERKIGDFPYVDLFANLQWKRTSIFVKYLNVGQSWANGDYFSALHYIRPQKVVQFGIHWPFYLH